MKNYLYYSHNYYGLDIKSGAGLELSVVCLTAPSAQGVYDFQIMFTSLDSSLSI